MLKGASVVWSGGSVCCLDAYTTADVCVSLCLGLDVTCWSMISCLGHVMEAANSGLLYFEAYASCIHSMGSKACSSCCMLSVLNFGVCCDCVGVVLATSLCFVGAR